MERRGQRSWFVAAVAGQLQLQLAHLNGDRWLMASVMYGAGMRLMECLRLRVQDVDFSRNEITIRAIHERDVADGWRRVPLLLVSPCVLVSLARRMARK